LKVDEVGQKDEMFRDNEILKLLNSWLIMWKLHVQDCSTQLWWDYSEGWSKCESSCLNFDLGKKVIKMSRELPYKEIHVIFWQLFCVGQNANNMPAILTPLQNSPTTAVLQPWRTDGLVRIYHWSWEIMSESEQCHSKQALPSWCPVDGNWLICQMRTWPFWVADGTSSGEWETKSPSISCHKYIKWGFFQWGPWTAAVFRLNGIPSMDSSQRFVVWGTMPPAQNLKPQTRFQLSLTSGSGRASLPQEVGPKCFQPQSPT
jgi:hypothetical protein